MFSIAVLKAGQLVATGICLGLGFYVSKKITEKIDETLFLYDTKALQQLVEESKGK
jgi:hypothetical protein